MAGFPWEGKRGGFKVLVATLSVALVYSYNIDLDHPVIYQGPNNSFFGYSVLEHYYDNTRWILVGAPKADSKYSASLKSPGAVYKCRVHTNPDRRCTELDMGRANVRGTFCGKTCKEDRDDEWMGVSLARQPTVGGSILACAHRWKNVYYETEYILPHGFCNIIPPNLGLIGKKLMPCYEEYKKKYGEEHGSCQAGIAGFFTEELVIMGAPGSYYWTGTIKVLNLTDNTYFKLKDESVIAKRYVYLGYAVTAGHFSQLMTTDVVGGAPQDGGIGKVYIFRTDRNSGSLIKIFQASGKKMGSYFGSSLCAVDLNSDGLSDLLVGAPMFSEIRDEGQVTVFLSRGNGVMEEQRVLDGNNAYNAHFGESMASLGDIDDDGFPDVAIGAPKEDDYAGAVYIYHGYIGGIIPRYSMRISGRMLSPWLQMFGQSISGEVDMDENGYPDVTIGAFMSNNVVLLRSRPVITLDISIFLPASIDITAPQCHDGLQQVNCLNITACFSFKGKHVPGLIDLNYNLTSDVAKKEKGYPIRIYFISSGEATSQITEQMQLSYMQKQCINYLAFVKRRVKDVISPIVFEATYSLGENIVEKEEKGLPALKPVLRRKKGQKMSQRNQTIFERNCQSDDCAADLKLQCKLFLSRVKNTKICSRTLTNHSPAWMELEYGKGLRRSWRLNDNLFRYEENVKVCKKFMKEFFVMNMQKGTSMEMVWDASKAYMQGILIYLNNKYRKKQGEKGKELEEEIRKQERALIVNPTDKKIKEAINLLKGQFNMLIADQVATNLQYAKHNTFCNANKPGRWLAYLLRKKQKSRTIEKIKYKGKEVYEQELIKKSFLKFYSRLYTGDKIQDTDIDRYLQKENIYITSKEQRDSLNQLITSKEILFAIKQLKVGKAPGTNGLTAVYYKSLQEEMVEPLKELFNNIQQGGEVPPTWKTAFISLIPKEGQDHTDSKNYRPISLLNTDYKIFAKILANRLMTVMQQMIHHDQTGFINGRQMKSNVRQIVNLLEYLGRNNQVPAVLVFLDAEKAFDRLNWYFLFIEINRKDATWRIFYTIYQGNISETNSANNN
ncbi:integrin alpha-9 isoform X1 [Pantherophis guttatus]|uniref:Integrin alpha-9 isoform X1 n=1 Tax=Pantherophis guttatus TaxID=94885 RepID=A0ABM3Z124_PANGU|nr:integrin alpha-9 isoform X1 [Pantherophis guttatus]